MMLPTPTPVNAPTPDSWQHTDSRGVGGWQ